MNEAVRSSDARSAPLLKRFSNMVNIASLRGEVLQAKPPSQREIGVDWVPAMASLSIIVPEKVSTAPSKRLRASKLPKQFSWSNADDVAKAGKGKMVLGPVRNQLTCGSCWAVSSANVLSHRYSIATQTTTELSETFPMSCMSGYQSQQCNGGFPLEAGDFFEKRGTVSSACYPYNWCENQPACAQQGQGEAAGGSNGYIPPCGEACVTCPNGGPTCDADKSEFKLFKAKTGSTKQLVTIEDIKADLFTYGPVVGAYAVYADFLVAGQNNYAATAGVYINKQSGDSPYGSDPTLATQNMGFHAVTIVGWGEQEVPGFGTVPYWEVQNSWGDKWANGGFWKHAMSDKDRDINWKVGMDIPALFDIQGKEYVIGGATTFLPDTDYAPTNGGGNNGGNNNGNGGNGNGNGGNNNGNGGNNNGGNENGGFDSCAKTCATQGRMIFLGWSVVAILALIISLLFWMILTS